MLSSFHCTYLSLLAQSLAICSCWCCVFCCHLSLVLHISSHVVRRLPYGRHFDNGRRQHRLSSVLAYNPICQNAHQKFLFVFGPFSPYSFILSLAIITFSFFRYLYNHFPGLFNMVSSAVPHHCLCIIRCCDFNPGLLQILKPFGITYLL